MTAESDAMDAATVRVIAGSPSDSELAAVIAVLTAAAAEQPTGPVDLSAEPNAWARSQRSLRTWSSDAKWSS